MKIEAVAVAFLSNTTLPFSLINYFHQHLIHFIFCFASIAWSQHSSSTRTITTNTLARLINHHLKNAFTVISHPAQVQVMIRHEIKRATITTTIFPLPTNHHHHHHQFLHQPKPLSSFFSSLSNLKPVFRFVSSPQHQPTQ